MGRERKNLDYFPMDVDVFQDIKIRKLIKYQGSRAFCVYAYLLCCIYKNGYYMEWDDELPFIISEATGCEEAYVREVIKCCMVVGLISKPLFDEHQVLSSKGIQERFVEISAMLRRKSSQITRYSLTSQEDADAATERSTVEACAPDGEESDYYAELRENTSFREMVRARYGLTSEELSAKLDMFLKDCACRGTRHRDRRDALNHFNDWLRIVKEAESKKKDGRETERNTRAANRRGVQAGSHEGADYTGTF